MIENYSPEQRPLRRLNYEVFIDKKIHNQVRLWCIENWGARWSIVDNRDGRWAMYWAGIGADKYRVCFDNEEDMMWFKLRWS
jgi:hypothetical protein